MTKKHVQTFKPIDFDAALKKVKAGIIRKRGNAKKPATDKQLALIWPAWNKLTDTLLPEEKVKILTFVPGEPRPQYAEYAKESEKICREFAYLPLDQYKYAKALELAVSWENLNIEIASTRKHHDVLVKNQSALADADSQAYGRIVALRLCDEINLTHPGLLENKCPSIENIKYVFTRKTAYTISRREALKALSDLVFKYPGMRTGRTLPLEKRALGVPNPPSDVHRYLFIARLDSLGICSMQRLQKFMRDDLPTLSREERQEFYRMSLKPKYGKEPYAALRVWLLENRPVFAHPEFTWQWGDIQTAAQKLRVAFPSSSLKQWASNNRIGLHLRTGPATLDDGRILKSTPLLIPAPVFGEILDRRSN